jgi:hypothetical protein
MKSVNSRKILQNHGGASKVRNLGGNMDTLMSEALLLLSINVLNPHELGPGWMLDSDLGVKHLT